MLSLFLCVLAILFSECLLPENPEYPKVDLLVSFYPDFLFWCVVHSVISSFLNLSCCSFVDMAPQKKASSLSFLLGHFRARPPVCPKLLCSKGLSTGAASPLCVWSHQVSRARAEPGIFAGTERHHQFTTACQALSLTHRHVVTTSLAAFVWSQLNTVRHLGRGNPEDSWGPSVQFETRISPPPGNVLLVPGL